jgi:osmotically-inducible protein OsmY
VTNDRQLQRDILAELDREPGLAPGTIGVEVHHGSVKLAGRVSDPTIKRKVELAAHRVEGAITVVMDIDVAAAGTVPRTAGATHRAA